MTGVVQPDLQVAADSLPPCHIPADWRVIPGMTPRIENPANLLPDAARRDDPESVEEVLAWADEPLATAEVAAVCDISLTEARERLARVAHEQPLGADGLWSLEPVAA